MKTNLKIYLLLLALLSLPGFARAQGTAISYQGRLNDRSAPATGLYDFTFAVYDADLGGVLMAGPDVLNAVPVNNGLFNVALDFGPSVFTGPARWLEISVRTNSVGELLPLTPRTPLLATPYSLFAEIARDVMDSTIEVDHFDTSGPPMPGQFLSYNGAQLSWSDPDVLVGNIWSQTGTVAHYNAGNVGIGTTTPASKLTIQTPTLGYGIEHTDGDIRLSTFVGRSKGYLGTLSNHKLTLFANDNGLPNMTATLDTAGNFGIRTDTPAYPLTVNGEVHFTPGGPGGAMHFGTPNGETGMTWANGTTRADLRFDGSTVKLLAGASVGPPGNERGISVTTAGNVGIGTATPQSKLEVNGDVRINSGSGLALNAEDGPMITRGWDPFDSTASLNRAGHGRWGLFMEPSSLVCGFPDLAGKTFDVRTYAPGGGATLLLRVTQAGNVGIGTGAFPGPQQKLHVIGNILASGTITGSSDRNVKRDFTPVNSSEVLDKVAALPISTWSYIAEDGVRHLGPMAQDFYSAFSVGMDDKHISMVDADGVALAAIQGLNQKLEEQFQRRDAENAELKRELGELKQLLNLLTESRNGGVR